MAKSLYTTAQYTAFEMRGGGALLRHIPTMREVFFQPGDDAGTVYEALDAIETEVPENRRDTVFNVYCSQYV